MQPIKTIRQTLLLFAVVVAAVSSMHAQPKKPAPAKPKASASAATKDKAPLYPVVRAVAIGRGNAVVLNYDPQSLNPRVNQYLEPVNRDSVKAVLRLAQLAYWPEGINTAAKFAARESEIPKYKGHQLLRYVDDTKNLAIALIWIPRSENSHMPGDMIPTSAEGIYMAVDDNAVSQRVSGKKARPAVPAPVVKGLTKEFAMKVEYLQQSVVYRMDEPGLERARAALVGNGKFTEAEFTEMAERANIRNYPPRLSTMKQFCESQTFSATGYVQGSFLLPFNGIAEWTHLVWIPMADNAALKEDFKDGKDLFFFIHASNDPYAKQSAAYTWPTTAVAAIKAKHSKAMPEIIPKNIHSAGEEAAYKPLRDAGYSETEAGRIMQLCTPPYLPEGLEYRFWYSRYDEIEKLKAYRIAEFPNGYGTLRLYWIPREDNSSAPADLLPMTDEGAFTMAYISRKDGDKEDKALTSRKYANKAEWDYYRDLYRFYTKGGTDAQIAEMGRKTAASSASNSTTGSKGSTSATTTSNGISYSSADMSEFTRNASQGSIMLYYGWSGKPASAYIYELRGSSLNNKQAVADILVKRTSQSGGSFIGFEHFPGNCQQAMNYIKRKAGDGIASTCSGEHKLD